MDFRASFCDPFKKDIIDLGTIPGNKIMETFDQIPWASHLDKMENTKEKIYYSPSLEIENMDNLHGISISAIDHKNWYVMYKRPKEVSYFFGLLKKMDHDYLSEALNLTVQDVKKCITALIKNDFEYLESIMD